MKHVEFVIQRTYEATCDVLADIIRLPRDFHPSSLSPAFSLLFL